MVRPLFDVDLPCDVLYHVIAEHAVLYFHAAIVRLRFRPDPQLRLTATQRTHGRLLWSVAAVLSHAFVSNHGYRRAYRRFEAQFQVEKSGSQSFHPSRAGRRIAVISSSGRCVPTNRSWSARRILIPSVPAAV